MTLSGPVKQQLEAARGYVYPTNGALVSVSAKKGAVGNHLLNGYRHRSAKVWQFLGHKLAVITTAKQRKRLLDVVAKGDLADVMDAIKNAADLSVKNSLGQSLVYVAAANDFHLVLTLLLDRGANANEVALDGTSPMHVACNNNHDRSVNILLKYNARTDVVALNGYSPLHLAAKQGHSKVVAALLSARAKCDFPVQNSATTALLLACMAGHSNVVEQLLDAGADPQVEDANGNTPLHFTSRDGNYRATYLLLTAGADPDMPNELDETAFDMAERRGHSHVQYLLETNGMGVDDKTVDEMDLVCAQNARLSDTLAQNRPEIAEVIVKLHMKYAGYLALGVLPEDKQVTEFLENPNQLVF
ncbi:Ankyrin [Plasmopara halstedii]|uniref:Ankyrin n=1 Tax=Plasmopara halstedii TaxID=4781 RepID=A0A0P1B5G1_PLAHL|nr:Ankyrin [Plasmopara halstedii]CEG50023.1 Ankyrin [Plasmopara halstedii]|eukprot:XP_024586392.1 Ankyrin [Plasmopara halstedii]